MKLGKDRWYEKISMSYSGKITNSVNASEKNIFSRETLDNMRNGVQHSIPVQASFNVFNYLNITPSVNYTERWYFKKTDRRWNPETNKVETLDPSTDSTASTTTPPRCRSRPTFTECGR